MASAGSAEQGRWATPALEEEARAWVRATCRDHTRLTGSTEVVRDQPWAVTVRFDTTGPPVWFKACGPGVEHEARLVLTLAQRAPQLVPPVLAADEARGWFLAEDAGPTMRLAVGADDLWPQWELLLSRYAQAQLDLAAHQAELVATGLPVRSPTSLPGQAADLVARLRVRPPDKGGLTEPDSAALQAQLRPFAQWCNELAASGIADSIQHDDLHSANVCWPGGAAEARIIDWGDASLGFPLATMLCTMNSIAFFAGCEVDDVRVLRVRDAYLEPFSHLVGRRDLVRLVDLARRTGAVTRALCYELAYTGDDGEKEAADEFPVREWLRRI